MRSRDIDLLICCVVVFVDIAFFVREMPAMWKLDDGCLTSRCSGASVRSGFHLIRAASAVDAVVEVLSSQVKVGEETFPLRDGDVGILVRAIGACRRLG